MAFSIGSTISTTKETFMKLVTFTLLILFVSCGQGKRCYSKEEAMLACQAEEMSNKQVTNDVAILLCKPYYSVDKCYSL